MDLGIVVLRGLIATEEQLVLLRRPPHWMPITNLTEDVINGIDGTFEGRRAAAEALSWLKSHDLIAEVHQPGANQHGTMLSTRLGREIAKIAESGSAAGFALRAIDLIPISMRAKVLVNLASGDYDLAIIAAFKQVEVTMRSRAALSNADFGSRLSKKFFQRVATTKLQRAESRGQLADEEHLFEGLFGMYRDRAAHEVPHVDSIEYALEVIIAAAHLLRVVEAAEITP